MPKNKYTKSSGNVFLDMGVSEEEASELTMKSFLFDLLQEAVKKELETCSQKAIAERLGVDQPVISKIINDKMSLFAIERIVHFILKLHYDIHLEVRPASLKRDGKIVAGVKKKLRSA